MQHLTPKEFPIRMREQCLGIRIGRLHRVIGRHFDKAMRPLGLSPSQLEVLAVLTLRRAIAPSMIAEALALKRSTVSRNVTLMERNGWVETDSAPSGRTRTVSITADGSSMLASAEAAWIDAQEQVTELLGPSARAILDTWLAKLSSLED